MAREGISLHPVWGVGSMAESYLKQVDGFIIGKDSLACGLAVPSGRPVLTRDVFEEPLWKPWLSLAEQYGFRGCWSFPIKTRDNKAVGTFATFFRTPREATPHDLALADVITQSAAVIISSHIEAQGWSKGCISLVKKLKIASNRVSESTARQRVAWLVWR